LIVRPTNQLHGNVDRVLFSLLLTHGPATAIVCVLGAIGGLLLLPFVYTEAEQMLGMPLNGALFGAFVSATAFAPATWGAEILARRWNRGRFFQLAVVIVLFGLWLACFRLFAFETVPDRGIVVLVLAVAYLVLLLYWTCVQICGVLASRYLPDLVR